MVIQKKITQKDAYDLAKKVPNKIQKDSYGEVMLSIVGTNDVKKGALYQVGLVQRDGGRYTDVNKRSYELYIPLSTLGIYDEGGNRASYKHISEVFYKVVNGEIAYNNTGWDAANKLTQINKEAHPIKVEYYLGQLNSRNVQAVRVIDAQKVGNNKYQLKGVINEQLKGEDIRVVRDVFIQQNRDRGISEVQVQKLDELTVLVTYYNYD